MRPSRLRTSAVAGTVTLLWGVPALAAGQEGCEFGSEGNDVVNSQAVAGQRITYISNPHFLCEGGVQIWADSAVVYAVDAFSHFVGAVRYLEGAREMRADEARYFSELGRLQARGRLSVVDSSDGSTIENGDLVYLRATDSRRLEEMTVTTGADGVRPSARVRRSQPGPEVLAPEAPENGSPGAGSEVEPYTVVAERLEFRGGSHLTAVEDVVIERDSMVAYADRAEYDGATDDLLLEGSARVLSTEYDLVGRTIRMAPLDEGTDELRAIRDAVLTGEDLQLTAPLILVYLAEGSVERLVAVPLPADLAIDADSVAAPRPLAVAQEFELTADSLELLSPADALERIVGVGRARSDSRARDSLNVDALPEIFRTDWLEGDTIVVTLAPSVSVDSTEWAPADAAERQYEVERIVAMVGARSLYRLHPSDSTAQIGFDAPALHYVVGDEITIYMVAGEVESMEVVGETQGLHLEPLRATPADTLASPAVESADTTRAAPPSARRDDPARDQAAPRAVGMAAQPWRRR